MNLSYLFKEARYYNNLGKGHFTRMLIKFVLAKTPAKIFVNTWGYNKVYNYLIKKKARKIQPTILQIENTNLCNAHCLMCPHNIMKRKAKIMSFKDFVKICKNVLNYLPIELITITGFGEPFIDKDIINKIRWINDNYPNIKIDIYTNASLLDNATINALLDTKIHKINFSINGTERSYKKIVGLEYNKTKNNILNFLEQKKQKKLSYPLTNISLMVVKENLEEFDEIIRFWRDKTDSIMAYAPSDWAGKLKSASIINQSPFKKKRWPCMVLFNSVTVDVEGNVIMCCRDYESRVKFGNVVKNSIKEIRESSGFKELLIKQLAQNYKTPVCDSCDNSFDSSLNWW